MLWHRQSDSSLYTQKSELQYNIVLDLELEPRIFNSSSPETFLQKVTNKVLKNPQTGHLEYKQKKEYCYSQQSWEQTTSGHASPP